MKKIALALLSLTMLAGCSVAPTASLSDSKTGDEVAAKMFESFGGFVGSNSGDGAILLGLTAKSLTGKTFRAESVMPTYGDGSKGYESYVNFGTDNKLYLQSYKKDGCFLIGTYEGNVKALKAGDAVKFKLTEGTLKMERAGALSDRGDQIGVYLDRNAKRLDHTPTFVKR